MPTARSRVGLPAVLLFVVALFAQLPMTTGARADLGLGNVLSGLSFSRSGFGGGEGTEALATDGDDGTRAWFGNTGGLGNPWIWWTLGTTKTMRHARFLISIPEPMTLALRCFGADSANLWFYQHTGGRALVDTGLVTFVSDCTNSAIWLRFVAYNGFGTPDGSCTGSADVCLFSAEIYGVNGPQDFAGDKAYTFGLARSGAYSADPVNLATGVFTAQAHDLSIPGRVLPLEFSRWYNSADATTGPLGPAWTHTYNWTVADLGATVEVRRGDGRRDMFVANGDGTYANPPDTFDVLTKNGDGTFTLSLPSMVTYEFSAAGRLNRVHEPSGNEITLEYTGGVPIANSTNLELGTYSVTGNNIDCWGSASGGVCAAASATTYWNVGPVWGPLYVPSGTITVHAHAVVTSISTGAGSDGTAKLQLSCGPDPTSGTAVRTLSAQTPARAPGTWDDDWILDSSWNGHYCRVNTRWSNEVTIGPGSFVTWPSAPPPPITLVTDTAGRVVSLVHDLGTGRLTAVEDPAGRKIAYGYDAAGRLASVTDRIGNAPGEDPAEHRWQYAYDGATRHLTSITDPDGRVRVTNTYDIQGRVVEQRDGLNELTTIVYGNLVTSVTDPRGHETTYTFDSRMRVLSQTDVLGANTYTVSYTYDAVGNRTSVTDREGNTTDLTYDARGNVLTKTDPSPDGTAPRPVTTFEYDARNNLTEIIDAAGATTTLTYDPATNVLLSVTRQVDATTTATTSYEYGDPANPGLPTRIYSPLGNAAGTPDPTFSTSLAYDADGNLVSRTDADGATTTFQYDDVGRLMSFVDPDGNATGGVPALHTWTVEYDENDREIGRNDPEGGEIEYAYDGAGNRSSLTDRNGNVTSYDYDANARLREVSQKPDPAGATVYTTVIERDDNGNATRITQGNGVMTDYAFDPLNRLMAVTTYPAPASPLTTTYVLDGNGQPTSRTTGDGATVTYSYDALARLTSVSGPSLSIGYEYDTLGRRTAMTDALGTTTYDYDDVGRVMEISSPLGTVGYDYDLDGNRILLLYPGGDPVTYEYSAGGRLEQVTDWAARTSTYSYTPSGLVDTLSQHGDLTATYTYDRAQRLTGLQYTRTVGGVPVDVASQAFTLDAEGNRTQLVESTLLGGAGSSDTFTYEYDGLSRLLSADAVLFGGGSKSETFSYDAATNIQTRTGPAATYTMDGANRVTADGTQSFTWDGADRLTQRGADTFSYDALSRLTSATVAGATSTYSYDGDGLLATRTSNAGTTHFVWDTSVALAPILEAGTDRVVHGLGPLYLARSDGSTIRLVRDALGSVRAEISDLGLVTKAFRYAAYGVVSDRFPSNATPTLLGFAGELADPSGLTYLRLRWYDSSSGRFMTRDPLSGEPLGPPSLNGYSYVAGSPTMFTDPSGLCAPFCVVMGVGAVVGGATSWSAYQIGCRPLGNCTVAGAAGAAVSGAVTGALIGLAGPAAGTLVGSSGALAGATAVGLRGVSGVAGYLAGGAATNGVTLVQGRQSEFAFSGGHAILAAASAGLVGTALDKAFPLHGVSRLSQGRFAPQHFLSAGPNAERLYMGAFAGGFLGILAAMASAASASK